MPSAGEYCNFLVSRAYRRVPMRRPVRLRWTSPLAQKIELAETMDASRGPAGVPARVLPCPTARLWTRAFAADPRRPLI